MVHAAVVEAMPQESLLHVQEALWGQTPQSLTAEVSIRYFFLFFDIDSFAFVFKVEERDACELQTPLPYEAGESLDIIASDVFRRSQVIEDFLGCLSRTTAAV